MYVNDILIHCPGLFPVFFAFVCVCGGGGGGCTAEKIQGLSLNLHWGAMLGGARRPYAKIWLVCGYSRMLGKYLNFSSQYLTLIIPGSTACFVKEMQCLQISTSKMSIVTSLKDFSLYIYSFKFWSKKCTQMDYMMNKEWHFYSQPEYLFKIDNKWDLYMIQVKQLCLCTVYMTVIEAMSMKSGSIDIIHCF